MSKSSPAETFAESSDKPEHMYSGTGEIQDLRFLSLAVATLEEYGE